MTSSLPTRLNKCPRQQNLYLIFASKIMFIYLKRNFEPGDEDMKSASVGVGISLWPPAVEAATETSCSLASGPIEEALETLSVGGSDFKVFQVLSFVTYFTF
jgi:hypothetical protein